MPQSRPRPWLGMHMSVQGRAGLSRSRQRTENFGSGLNTFLSTSVHILPIKSSSTYCTQIATETCNTNVLAHLSL